MINDDVFNELQEIVRKSSMDDRFSSDDSVNIGVIAGPAVVVEVIVKKASMDCGVPMDWHYCGGRGVVYALGNHKQVAKAKQELWLNMPISNLN